MEVYHNLILALDGYGLSEVLTIPQGDRKSHYLNLTFTQNGVTYALPVGTTPQLWAEKPDGHAVTVSGKRNSDGTATIEVTAQTLVVTGEVSACIKLINGNSVLGSPPITINVTPVPDVSDTAASSDEFQALLAALGKAGSALTLAQLKEALGGMTISANPADFGLTGTNYTAVDLFAAMPNNSLFIGAPGYNGLPAKAELGIPYNGIIVIFRITNSRSLIINDYGTLENVTQFNFLYSRFVTVDGVTSLAPWAELVNPAPESVALTPLTVEGVSVSALNVRRIGAQVSVELSVTLTDTLSNWTSLATGMPLPMATIYDTAMSWTASYTRPLRVSVNAAGALNIRYGAAGTYAITISYIAKS